MEQFSSGTPAACRGRKQTVRLIREASMNGKLSKHRVVTNAKYCAGGPFFWTEVVFRSRREIQVLIRELRNLLKSRACEAHIHLSDVDLSKDGPASSAEILFKRRQTKDQKEERARAIKSAEELLRRGKIRGDASNHST